MTFSIDGRDETISVFTTRADTLWGVSFMVLAPENPLAKALTTEDRRVEVDGYVGQAVRQTEIQREATDREKTGVFTGAYAVNPVNGRKVPVYVGDYVLMTYGTGAVMGVPAHDTRDFAFARKYEIDIPVVIAGPDWNGQELEEPLPRTREDGELRVVRWNSGSGTAFQGRRVARRAGDGKPQGDLSPYAIG